MTTRHSEVLVRFRAPLQWISSSAILPYFKVDEHSIPMSEHYLLARELTNGMNLPCGQRSSQSNGRFAMVHRQIFLDIIETMKRYNLAP